MTSRSALRSARVSFNEVVRCVRIAYAETIPVLQELDTTVLKAKPIIFRPRGQILPSSKIPMLAMECVVVSKPPHVTVCNGWYIDINMRLYYENENCRVKRTSPIVFIDGIVVTTHSGTMYCLGSMDVLVQHKLRKNCVEDCDPLNEDTIHYIINAVYDVYPTL